MSDRNTALVACSVLAMSATLAGCGGGAGPDEGFRGAPIPSVEAVEARSGSLPLEERLSGVVRAENQVTIYPEVSAPIEQVLVRSGQAVQRGQVLVRLDDEQLRGQLRQAEANVELAEAAALEADARVQESEAMVSRTRLLAAQQLISDIELETQEARYQAAKASAAQARARVSQAVATADERRSRLEDAVVRAPISGRIGQINAEIGMLVDQSTQLFVMGNLDRLVVEVPLTEAMLAYVGEGMPVRIRSSALGDEPLRAEVTRISPFLSQDSFSTVGEIDVRNDDRRLQPGMFVTVDVLYGASETATLVPTSALWEDPSTGLLGVYTVDGYGQGVALPTSGEAAQLSSDSWPVTFHPVEVRARGRESVGIDGVDEGTWVVTFGQNLFAAGQQEQQARVRPTVWESVIELQSLQRENLLHGFLEKQQLMARRHGAEPPSRDTYLTPGLTPGETPATPEGATGRDRESGVPLAANVAP
ncbi:MAG: efflux RND transporter periplasmic adaptor subunit [Acidobacteria bacterium]|nr:MAG: efflux RND transporter periplasmic adaptor subunit [Acidobacteriota bacterium]REK07835.1 MAG: efflux RND transporter periplasmic adaptor subunit [Acidobacteriota bacterium]